MLDFLNSENKGGENVAGLDTRAYIETVGVRVGVFEGPYQGA